MIESLPSDQHTDVTIAAARPVERGRQPEPVQVLEHYHRYLYASRFTKNKRVLVCGAGEGYGAAFVSLNAGSVFALDEDADRTTAAEAKYAEYPNLRFEAGDIAGLAIMEHSVDVAVCFDQINEFDQEKRIRLMDAVKRVLDPTGLFLVSAPIRSGDGVAENGPAFSGVEFFEFLKQHFRHVRFIAQKPLTMSMMWSLHEWSDEFFRFHAREDLFTPPQRIGMFSEPAEIVALCSDDDIPIDITNNSNSVYYDTVHAERAKKIVAEMEELRADIIRARTLIMRVTGERDAFRDAITVLTNENLSHLNALEAMQKEMDDRAARIVDLETSALEGAAVQDQLRQEYAEQVRNLELVQKELDERVARVMELEQALAESNSGHEYLKRMYDEQSVWAERLSGENASLLAKVREVERHYEESSLYATSAADENNQLRERIEILQRKIEETTDQLSEASLLIAEMKPKFEATTRDVEQMRDTTSESETRARMLEQQVNELRAALAVKTTAADEAEAKLKNLESADRTREEELRRISAASDQREREVEEIRMRMTAIETQRKTEENQASALTHETQKLRARLYELQKQFDERSAFARNASQENEKLKSRLTAIQKSLEEKTAASALAQTELTAVREKLQTIRQEFEQKLTSAQQWERDNRKKLEHLSELQLKIDEQALAMREMKIDSEKQATAFDTFQKSQSDLQQRYNRSQIRVQELQQDVSILERKIEQFRSSGVLKTLSKFGLFSEDQQ